MKEILKKASMENTDSLIEVAGREMSRETLAKLFIALSAIVIV